MSRKLGKNNLFLGAALLGLAMSQVASGAASVSSTTTTIAIGGKTVTVYTVTADGAPFYGTSGAAGFPSATYTHTPTKQSYKYYIPANPALAGTTTAGAYTPVGLSNAFGVALDGIPFDPLTSNCNGNSRSTENKCTFRVEGRLQTSPATKTSPYTSGRLGFDVHNGHSQSDGAYHYHGITCGIVTTSGGSAAFTCDPVSTTDWSSLPATGKVVGYARDGYPILVKKGIYASYSVVTTATAGRPTISGFTTLGNLSADMSMLVTSGTTFKMPSSKTFADFTYTGPTTGYGTSANLGLCNEAANTDASIKTLGGATAAYVYYLTPNFPMVPRCLIGLTDGSTLNAQGFYNSTVAFDGDEK